MEALSGKRMKYIYIYIYIYIHPRARARAEPFRRLRWVVA